MTALKTPRNTPSVLLVMIGWWICTGLGRGGSKGDGNWVL